MALTATFKVEAYNASGTNTTSSFTPSNNCILVAITQITFNGSTEDVEARQSVSGGGLTWTKRVAVPEGTNSWDGTLQIWTAVVSTGASMTVTSTADTTGRTIERNHLQVIEITGSFNVDDFIGALAEGNGNGTGAYSITLSAAPASSSLVIAAVCADHNAAPTITPASGWTEIERGGVIAEMVVQSQYRSGSTSTTVGWDSVSGFYGRSAVAVELEELTGTQYSRSASLAAAAAASASGSIRYFIRPSADTSAGSWTSTEASLFDAIDEVAPSDADYIQSSVDPANDTVKIALSDPGVSPDEPMVVRYRYSRTGSTGSMELRVRLLEGTTEIASWTHSAITTTWVEAEQTLSSGEFGSITDVTNLFLEFRANLT